MINSLPPAPSSGDSIEDFNNKAFALVGSLAGFVADMNSEIPAINQAITASAAAMAAANFKGDWATLTGALNVPASVSYGGNVWLLIANTSNVASDTPGVSAKWFLYSSYNNVYLNGIREKVTIAATAATGTINFDVLDNSIGLLTANAVANWTLNVRGNSTTTLDSIMAVGQSISIAHMVTQGATPFYNNVFKIDGVTITPKWQAGTAPSSGNASGIDSYSYAIIKTGAATFVVLASQTKFA